MAERGGGGGRAAPRKRAKVGEVTSGTGGLPPLRFRGSTHFRQRVICALLSGRSIRIDDIRPSPTEGPGGSVDMGLLGYEASFLRLVDAITNGTEIDINESGTTLQLRPGFVTGGKVEHDCGTRRSIGWFLEGIIPLALFSKLPLHATLLGVTNDDLDWSVDTIRAITIPFLKRFGVAEEGGLGIKIVKRGAPPNGGGEVIFTCPISRQLTAMQLTDAGLVKRVRGNAYCTKVSPQMANRVAEATRGVLNDYLPDVWIHTDKFSGPTGGLSPGYGLALVAETTTGVLLGAETAAGQGTLPEDLGRKGAQMLLTEIADAGCVDSSHQSLALLLMTLCPEDVSKIRTGKLTEYTIQYLRHLRDFFGIVFKIKPEVDDATSAPTVILSCRGIGFKNMSRSAT